LQSLTGILHIHIF